MKKYSRVHNIPQRRTAAIGKTSKTAALPQFYGKDCSDGLLAIAWLSCMSKRAYSSLQQCVLRISYCGARRDAELWRISYFQKKRELCTWSHCFQEWPQIMQKKPLHKPFLSLTICDIFNQTSHCLYRFLDGKKTSLF